MARFKDTSEIPFLQPGDLLEEEDGTRYTVRHAMAKHVAIPARCECCLDEAVDYPIYIDEPWEGPQPVIAQGGGTLLVMPVVEWWGDWPHRVLRDGKQIFPDSAGGVSAESRRT